MSANGRNWGETKFFTDSKQWDIYMNLSPKRYKRLKWMWSKYMGLTCAKRQAVSGPISYMSLLCILLLLPLPQSHFRYIFFGLQKFLQESSFWSSLFHRIITTAFSFYMGAREKWIEGMLKRWNDRYKIHNFMESSSVINTSKFTTLETEYQQNINAELHQGQLYRTMA